MGKGFTPETARKAAAKSAEVRKRAKAKTPIQRAEEAAGRAVPELMKELLAAATGTGAFSDLPKELRLRALFKALEYGAGKPVSATRLPEEEPAPEAGDLFGHPNQASSQGADLFAGEAPSPLEGPEMPGRKRVLDDAERARQAEARLASERDGEDEASELGPALAGAEAEEQAQEAALEGSVSVEDARQAVGAAEDAEGEFADDPEGLDEAAAAEAEEADDPSEEDPDNLFDNLAGIPSEEERAEVAREDAEEAAADAERGATPTEREDRLDTRTGEKFDPERESEGEEA